MTTLTFTDPNRRDPEKIKQITQEMTQRFQAIDERLTLEHFDNFVDYGPEIFPHLAQLYWDPRVPNHPMEHFVYYEYVLRLNGRLLYNFTPYSETIGDPFLSSKGIFWQLLEKIDDSLLTIIHDYQIQNLDYWKDLYSEKELQNEIEAIRKRTSKMAEKEPLFPRYMSFVDPKQRNPEAVKKMTAWIAQELHELDSHLSLTHNDDFIDFGPKEGKFLAECPYDPEEDDPDDEIRDLPDTEYEIFYDNHSLFTFTPYSLGYGVHGDFWNGGILNIAYLNLSDDFIKAIEKIMNRSSFYNFYYWRKLYSPADFQYEARKLKEGWGLD
ncbi:hypothetical protein BH747_11355 [Enterococcus villorum]|uniref:Uncharacterized protein n=1 Tax=Enterococcus villorum TaxID=112904 RepID=A0A1V8YI67_9ENTE|nr:hypothetical protein [Enterococcus villorum]OQO68604.1 hypothetical protein BH747_11355 [Enterococcus villorum]OQO72304.1 hypothetical protein BH744_11760 [Enterococcus villorum]